jgi:CRP-like cAMP-binding protein
VKFLKSYNETAQYDEVVKNLELEKHPYDHVLFRQGDAADKFYIILTGLIGLFINTQDKTDNSLVVGVREIAKLTSGEAFGELGLLFNENRTATAVCLEKTDLLVLSKQVFEKYLSNAKNEKISTMLDFYQNLWIFRDLTYKEALKLSTKSTLSKCITN